MDFPKKMCLLRWTRECAMVHCICNTPGKENLAGMKLATPRQKTVPLLVLPNSFMHLFCGGEADARALLQAAQCL